VLQQRLETLEEFWPFEGKCIPAMLRSNAFPAEFTFLLEKPGNIFLACEDFLFWFLICGN